ncbi:hypothetical protein AVEN_128839-1 [Araneus ventricosus]|uniref:Uncharacterized protein n=1 Tax=Araneus ventricosus TaxID=182803 RepID=A0A4Y2TSW4_ARAVE|nr:hypothetical protein AVEN_128839-1 [Araneus ventricosus]
MRQGRLTRNSSLPFPWLTLGQVSNGRKRGDRNCKEPCLLFLCPTYGVSSDSNKGTIGEEYGLRTSVFHAKGSRSEHRSFTDPIQWQPQSTSRTVLKEKVVDLKSGASKRGPVAATGSS